MSPRAAGRTRAPRRSRPLPPSVAETANGWKPLEPQRVEALDAWLDLIEAPAANRRPSEFIQARSTEPSTSKPGVELAASTVWSAWLSQLVVGPEASERLELMLDDITARARLDPFGLSPETIRRLFPVVWALHRLYFRVFGTGHRNVPSEGPAVLAANHGGLLPFDGAMAITDVMLHHDPPRLVRAILDRWVADLPIIDGFMARAGQVIGTHENFDTLLAREEAVLVFPEGVDGIKKTVGQRNHLQRFRHGFVAKAIRARAPIIPVAIVGSDDQAPILFDIAPLARLLHLPTFPITPTFPWLGPIGLVPYPVSYRIIYGEPMLFHEEFGPGAAEDPELCRRLAGRVRRTIQELIDQARWPAGGGPA